VIDELMNMQFLKKREFVDDIFINPVRDTYPIYHKRFHKDFSSAVRSVKTFSKRIHLLGRSGAFWYNNSDHSIRMALDMGKFFLGQAAQALDYRSYFGGGTKEHIDAMSPPAEEPVATL
jgi:protoporphyrinogen oxidase